MDIGALWDDLQESLTPLLGSFRARLDDLDVSTKADHTLLSEADIAVQEHIVSKILAVDPTAHIVAEEEQEALEGNTGSGSGRTWIIDPIDGTAQFVRPDDVEFCSVICLLQDRRPVAAFVLAPELGPERSPIRVSVAGIGRPIEVNGHKAAARAADEPLRASVTRSSGTQPRPWEQTLLDAGFELKTRTTSQTLDMVRTCVDLSEVTEPKLNQFALFYRERQKVWDGAAGMCLAQASGLRVSDRNGVDRPVIDLDFNVAEPQFPSTLVTLPTLPAAIVDAFAE
nr:inositol monophosphatase family protein [Kibdelosporangium sp. MJ126-NF4]CEL19697.1 3'(2'),5'-bisphosphate nucleotidase [Kibdelosporangium sp. MJ126-NF4]CTQ96923.1 3'(2'),5'-bisphosphate nucleotidase (EC 3.1.3.7) [Kibdelosporangium sp. MJ126-NF4]